MLRFSWFHHFQLSSKSSQEWVSWVRHISHEPDPPTARNYVHEARQCLCDVPSSAACFVTLLQGLSNRNGGCRERGRGKMFK